MPGRLIIAAILLLATLARADARLDEAKEQVAAADIDYRLARFSDALAKYTKAYELYPVPALLFNIGQCHKNLKDYADAIFFFEGYLRDAPAATNRALVEDLIREARAELARTKRGSPGSPPPATPPPAVEPAPSISPSASPSISPSASPSISPSASPPRGPLSPARPIDDTPRRSRLLPGALIGGGITVSAAGAVFYYYGQKRGPKEKYVYADTRLLGGAMIGLGVASIAAGTFLWLRMSTSASSAPVAAITPTGGFLGWVGPW